MNVSRDEIDVDEKTIDSTVIETHMHDVDVMFKLTAAVLHYEEHGDVQLLLIKSFPFRSPFCLLRGFFA